MPNLIAHMPLLPKLEAGFTRFVANDWARMSVGWAAAQVTGNDIQHFLHRLGNGWRPGLAQQVALKGVLAGISKAYQHYQAVDAAWNNVFWDKERQVSQQELESLNARWNRAASGLMASRLLFQAARLTEHLPQARWDIPDYEAVVSECKQRLEAPEDAFKLPEKMPEVSVSAQIVRNGVREYWLRFPSPVRNNTYAWAHVWEPEDGGALPGLIWTEGLGTEFDHTPNSGARMSELARMGLRVIRKEAPSHERGCETGYYSGEAIVGKAPQGLIDAVYADVIERAVLTYWAKRLAAPEIAYALPVAVGGVSLGAYMSQEMVKAAGSWNNPDCKPDAFFGVTPSGNIMRTVLEGSLMQHLGVSDRLAAKGWTEERLRQVWGLVEQDRGPCIPGKNIVAIFGQGDNVLHYDSSRALFEKYGVPAENMHHVPNAGHFGVGVSFSFMQKPIRQLCEILYNEMGEEYRPSKPRSIFSGSVRTPRAAP